MKSLRGKKKKVIHQKKIGISIFFLFLFFIFNVSAGTENLGLNLTLINVTDTTPPATYITSPENKTYFSNQLTLSFTRDDTEDSLWYHINGNDNFTINSSIIFSTSVGSHTLFLYANDSSNNENVSTVSFSVEQAAGPSGGGGGGVTCPSGTKYNSTLGRCVAKPPLIEPQVFAIMNVTGNLTEVVESIGETSKEVTKGVFNFFRADRVFSILGLLGLVVISYPGRDRKWKKHWMFGLPLVVISYGSYVIDRLSIIDPVGDAIAKSIIYLSKVGNRVNGLNINIDNSIGIDFLKNIGTNMNIFVVDKVKLIGTSFEAANPFTFGIIIILLFIMIAILVFRYFRNRE